MVEAMRAEGGDEEVFAARHRLDPKRVRRWRERIEGMSAGAPPRVAAAAQFAPVRVVERKDHRSISRIEIALGRATIRVTLDFDANLLARIIAALEDSAC